MADNYNLSYIFYEPETVYIFLPFDEMYCEKNVLIIDKSISVLFETFSILVVIGTDIKRWRSNRAETTFGILVVKVRHRSEVIILCAPFLMGYFPCSRGAKTLVLTNYYPYFSLWFIDLLNSVHNCYIARIL